MVGVYLNILCNYISVSLNITRLSTRPLHSTLLHSTPPHIAYGLNSVSSFGFYYSTDTCYYQRHGSCKRGINVEFVAILFTACVSFALQIVVGEWVTNNLSVERLAGY